MDSIVDLLRDLSTREQPALTWYGPDGERVDLTGRTAANWIIKATNLLSMELSSEPGTRIRIDLPFHWRSVVWAMATWCTGAQIRFDDDADISITATPEAAPGGMDIIAIALPALARRVEDLPPDAIDGAADVMTQADNLIFPPPPYGEEDTGFGLRQRELLELSAPLTPVEGAASEERRILITGEGVRELVRNVPALWARGASLVLAPDLSAAAAEGVTHALHLPR